MKKLDKSKCKIKLCRFKDIRHIFEEFHYKKSAIGGGILVCFAMFIENKLVGGSVIGSPRHENKYKNCIDIRRLACLDSAPCNSESWFISKIIKWIAANTQAHSVLSYSDETVGHIGTIYKAANFQEVGKTSPTKFVIWNDKTYHPRSLSIDRDYSYKLRKAVEDGSATIETGLQKRIWIYSISNKLKRKKYELNVYSKETPYPSLFD